MAKKFMYCEEDLEIKISDLEAGENKLRLDLKNLTSFVYRHPNINALEEELKAALEAELERVSFKKNNTQKILDQLRDAGYDV